MLVKLLFPLILAIQIRSQCTVDSNNCTSCSGPGGSCDGCIDDTFTYT